MSDDKPTHGDRISALEERVEALTQALTRSTGRNFHPTLEQDRQDAPVDGENDPMGFNTDQPPPGAPVERGVAAVTPDERGRVESERQAEAQREVSASRR